MKYETIERIHKVAGRTVMIMITMTITIGGILGIIIGLVKLVEWLDKLTGWGQAGVAGMTAFLVLLFCSFMIAWAEDWNHDNPGQET